MATNFAPSSLLTVALRFHISEAKSCTAFINPKAAEKQATFHCKAAQSEEVTEDQTAAESSARTQLDLLELLTSSANTSHGDARRPTIREQLAYLTSGRDGDFTLPLGKKMKESLKSLNILTISQRRNIKRQAYLNEVSGRNDAAFFATIGAFVILPPVIILAVAIQTGYVQLFP